jgi:hypothetical protein
MGAVLEYINIYTIYSQISLIYNLGPGDQLRLSGIIAEVGADFFRGASTGAPVLMKKMIRGQIGWIYTVIYGHLLVITGYSWDYTFY